MSFYYFSGSKEVAEHEPINIVEELRPMVLAFIDHTNKRRGFVISGPKRVSIEPTCGNCQWVSVIMTRRSLKKVGISTKHEMFEHYGGVSHAGWSESTGANLWKSPTVDLHIPILRPIVIGWCDDGILRAFLAEHEMFEHCGGVSYAGWSEPTCGNRQL
ncbi:7126_t:CDS:2 [Dentiscutata erythropus]|uniref:7126_t:CDS:1 n=1 Tax=Dentiscutata erythropus TaxID=1348616 RepID=A0A9N8ZU34_9GLOM|nr:7126_t:CDS:2 [Dentiscutata erythropus]